MSNEVPNGILANQFWIDAKSYIDAAEILIKSESESVNQPIYFLLGHALELALKSYLLAKGVRHDELLQLGHDLSKAHKRTVELGLRLKGEYSAALIDRLSDFHKAFVFRYSVLTKDEHRLVLQGHLVRATDIFEIAASVCTQVHGAVLMARISAAAAGEFLIETWHMGLPEEGTHSD